MAVESLVLSGTTLTLTLAEAAWQSDAVELSYTPGGVAPQGADDEIAIKVVARDAQGREATTIFRVHVETSTDKAKPGKASLSEQLKQAGKNLRPNKQSIALPAGGKR